MAPTDLRNTYHFPSFNACPEFEDMDFNYYHTLGGDFYRPNRHWCLLAEITQVENFIRLRLLVKDRGGSTFPIAFYLNGQGPDPSQFKLGHTVAILYAHRHGFLDTTVGIRQEERSTFQVSPKYHRD